MTQAATARAGRIRKVSASASAKSALNDALSIAKEQGLLSGARNRTVRGRMPLRLVEQARKKTGIQSDSKLIEAALAHIAVADDYADWLLAQRSTVSRDIELEF